MRPGWYWILRSPCLMTCSRWAKPVNATLASGPRLRQDHMPPTGLRSGAYDGAGTRVATAGRSVSPTPGNSCTVPQRLIGLLTDSQAHLGQLDLFPDCLTIPEPDGIPIT